MDKTNELLTKEIEREIKNLSALENGSKEQSEAVESLAKLYRLKIEEMKNVSELEEKREARISEEQLKRDLSKQELGCYEHVRPNSHGIGQRGEHEKRPIGGASEGPIF